MCIRDSLSTELLVAHGNISVSPGGDDGQNTQLTLDLANDLFCGEIDEMFMLMYEVIMVNFSGFFKKIAAQYELGGEAQTKTGPIPANMASSI